MEPFILFLFVKLIKNESKTEKQKKILNARPPEANKSLNMKEKILSSPVHQN